MANNVVIVQGLNSADLVTQGYLAPGSITYNETASGGSVVGGTASVNVNYNEIMRNGALLSGIANVNATYSQAATGGGVADGAASGAFLPGGKFPPLDVPIHIIRSNGLRALKVLIKARHPTVKIPGLDGSDGYFR